PDLFVVAEYWHPDLEALKSYLELVDKQLMLFDVALHHSFHDASKQGGGFDMRSIFDGALVSVVPDHAVTLVDNHDTQPLQSLEAPVEPWFKPLAYAIILLRENGVPCVFYPDLFGTSYTDTGNDGNEYKIDMPAIECLPKLIEARSRFANGVQTDIFDDPNCIAFIRHGTADAPGCVVVMSNGEEEITLDESGKGVFPTNGGSVSVWVPAESG
ncbi:MAG: alpha-amylase, partial [Rhizobium sp.]